MSAPDAQVLDVLPHPVAGAVHAGLQRLGSHVRAPKNVALPDFTDREWNPVIPGEERHLRPLRPFCVPSAFFDGVVMGCGDGHESHCMRMGVFYHLRVRVRLYICMCVRVLLSTGLSSPFQEDRSFGGVSSMHALPNHAFPLLTCSDGPAVRSLCVVHALTRRLHG